MARKAYMSSTMRGALWVLGGTAAASLIYASAKFAGESANVWQLMFLRYLGSVPCVLVLARNNRRTFASLRSSYPSGLFLRALVGLLAAAATTYAAAHMPIADATSIGMLDGVLMVFLGVLFLGEWFRRHQICASALCVAGAFVVVAGRGAFDHLDAVYVFPAGIALAGALLGATEGLLIKTLALREDALTMVLYTNVIAGVLVAIPAVLTWRTTNLWINLTFMGFGVMSVACQYCNIRGYRLAPMSVIGPIGYAWILFAALIGLVWFGEIPTVETISGAIMIVAGGIWLMRVPPAYRAGRIPENKTA